MRWSVFLLLSGAMLAGVLYAQWQSEGDNWLLGKLSSNLPASTKPAKAGVNAVPSSEPVLASEPLLVVEELVPLADLSATVERPLFAPTRRPPEDAPTADLPVADTEPTPETPFEMSLSAIVMDDDERAAYFTNKSSGDFSRLAEGESLSGWLLQEVREDGVVLIKGGSRQELELRHYRPAPGAAKKAAANRVAQKRKARQRAMNSATQSGGAANEDDSGADAATSVRRPRRPLRGPRLEALQRAREAARKAQAPKVN